MKRQMVLVARYGNHTSCSDDQMNATWARRNTAAVEQNIATYTAMLFKTESVQAKLIGGEMLEMGMCDLTFSHSLRHCTQVDPLIIEE
ncbi:hypothetical protein PMI29_02421 [Pseudomonas sp. GM49]|uniref:hypothetical protein n=1 Tax=Pseudomonas sp. GM49 TaxID=1144331 RepID=UPI00026FDC19|nr:hypothetical protein [Pseudomonas sp. GM49]EJM67409.1 hypothetical protein PMI29_02421 [Pseudomonas sp. GM49]